MKAQQPLLDRLSAFLPTQGERLPPSAYMLLVFLCFLSYLPGITTIPPVDRDEPRFAQATKQMIETDNYTDIRFQDTPRYKKPIGIYWLQAASVKLFSPDKLNEIWAYRLPSFVSATVAVCLTAALGSLFWGGQVGFLAALFLMGSLLLNVEARLAKTDATLLAFFMASHYALAKLYIAHDKKPGLGNALLFWIAQGCAFLIKGPIAGLITLATIVTISVRNKNWRWLAGLNPLIGIPVMLLIVLPWFISIIAASHGAFLEASAGHDMLAKIWQGQERGMVPPGLYALVLVVSFFPASLFVLLSLPDIWKNRRDPLVLFCLGWIVPAWLVFEFSMTKLPHYVLPLYPALAILAAHYLVTGLTAVREPRLRWYYSSVCSLWFLAGCALAALPIFLSFQTDNHIPALFVATAFVLFSAQFFVLPFLRLHREKTVIPLVLSSLLFLSVAFGSLLPNLQQVWFSRRIAETVTHENTCMVLTDGYNEPSLVFLAGTKTHFINDGADLAHALKETPCALAIVSEPHRRDFLFLFEPSEITRLGAINGTNLGSGRDLNLTLYRLAKK